MASHAFLQVSSSVTCYDRIVEVRNMYMDADSMMLESTPRKSNGTCERWISSISKQVLTREDLYLLYGSWAGDAAASAFLRPVDDPSSLNTAYAA